MNVVISRQRSIDDLPLLHHPLELPFFKKLTEGHAILIASKTLLELAISKKRNTRLLHGRQIYVLTRSPHKLTRFADCIPVTSVQDVIKLTSRIKIFASGGSSIFRQFIELPHVGAINVAEIGVDHHGERKFPELFSRDWRVYKKSTLYPEGNGNRYTTMFTTYIPAVPVYR